MFFAIVLLIYIAIEIYTYFGLKSFWRGSKSRIRIIIKVLYFIILTASALAIISLLFFRDTSSTIARHLVSGTMIINLWTKVFILPFLVIDDVRRLFLRFTKSKDESRVGQGIKRSEFLQKAGLIAASIPLSTLSTGIVIGGAYRYKIHRQNLSFSNFPKAFDGLKIVQISDIHSGSFYDKPAVLKGIKMILDEKPDIVFFTGDIVNERAVEMENYYDVFSKITAPMGVYSILGNHDYGKYHDWPSEEEELANFDAVKSIHSKLGWKLLLDEHFYLEKGKEKIGIMGVENWGRDFGETGDLKKAHQDCEAPFKILLSHDPTHWEDQVIKDFKDIDLTLSGHTHGMQMGIETGGFKFSPIQLRYSRWAGLYEEGQQKLYINRGFGFIGYPGRIGIWPEITVIELNHQT